MNTPLITEDPAVARTKLRAVRTALHRKADAEYQALEAGYEHLAAGRKLLNLRDALLACPLDAQGRPRLAVARADRRQVRFNTEPNNRGTFDASALAGDSWNRDNRARRYPMLVQTFELSPWPTDRASGWALVPIIPPEIRMAAPIGTADRDTFILWEVEAWAARQIGSAPDRDPYWLQPLAGDLYVVLGEWDLTELERAVMSGRARQ